MAKNDHTEADYVLIALYWDDSDDYESHWHWETDMEFYKDSQLKDLPKLMKEHGIKKWAPMHVEPGNFDSWGDKNKTIGMLLQIRQIEIKPMQIVTSWGYVHPTYQGD